MKTNGLKCAVAASLLAVSLTATGSASPAEAADRAFEMGMKYAGMGYYLAPSHEGHAGFATTLEFEVPVNRGLDYIFILAGDRNCQDVDVWVEAEQTGNEIVRDTRKVSNGLCGVRWRSDYNGSVVVVVHFARVTSRCGWAALVGRRGTVMAPFAPDSLTIPGTSIPGGGAGVRSGSGNSPGATNAVTQ